MIYRSVDYREAFSLVWSSLRLTPMIPSARFCENCFFRNTSRTSANTLGCPGHSETVDNYDQILKMPILCTRVQTVQTALTKLPVS